MNKDHADRPLLTLIDGSGFIFRAYHAIPPLTRADGTPVNAVFGFCNMLLKLLLDDPARDQQSLAVIFDAGRDTFRQRLYADYKANRPEPPADLIPQFALVKAAVKAFGLPAIEQEQYEADDLIASYARAGQQAGYRIRIISSDKDLMQLIQDNQISLYDAMKDRVIDEAAVVEKFGVPPPKVRDVLALMGDSSDNVPGVSGIGVKTAAALIGEYGSLEGLLHNRDEIKQPKRRAKLEEETELARLSYELVTLKEDLPLPEPLTDLERPDLPVETLQEFFRENNFSSLEKRLVKLYGEAATGAPSTDIEPRIDYQLLTREEELATWLKAVAQQGYFAIDVETDSLQPMSAKLVGIALAHAPGQAAYIPLGHHGQADLLGENQPKPQLSLETVIKHLGPYLEDDAILKIGHNIKYDALVLAQHGLHMVAMDDTMLMSYVLGAGLHNHGLDELAKRYFDHSMISYKELTAPPEGSRQRVTLDALPAETVAPYAAEDADYTLRLHQHLKPRLLEARLLSVYEELERPLIPVITQMEKNGICLDQAILTRCQQEFQKQLEAVEKRIYHQAGHSFNIASPKQLGQILFEELGLPTGKKNSKSGQYSTNVDVLEDLSAQGHVIADDILTWRSIAKLMSTYTDALTDYILPQTGRVHTSFAMAVTTTGRLSSSEPNLQNIPIRSEAGRQIRSAFVAAPGCLLLSVDYSQIELRLLAEIADITPLQEAFQADADIHRLTAAQVFGLKQEEVSSLQRRQAKAINFGIIYGISAFGLAKQLDCSQGEAKSYIDAYLERYHGIKNYMAQMREQARAHGYVETLFGRRCHVPNIHSKNNNLRNFAERQAINAPLQGTAADLIKRAMIHLHRAQEAGKLDGGAETKLLLQVHDELILETPEASVKGLAQQVQTIMEQADLPHYDFRVPLKAAADWGPNWADAH